ncbi:MAG: glycosyltransferase family 1 protein [Candidatus Berkelbacteria bacterium]|nr:glycosyltransferase family 1 protein [Candidatus Berkelbacteria bacterium]
MKIGIDASKLSVLQKTGTEYYTKELINQLILLDRKNDYILYSKEQIDFSLPSNFQNQVISMPYLWTKIGLSAKMLVSSPDKLFIPAHIMPIFHPKTIVTFHDIAFEKFPECYSVFQRWYLKNFAKNIVKKATKIIAVSNSTKKDLIEYFNCPKEKIEVVYHGYDNKIFKPVTKPKQIVNGEYLLSVGRIEKRKNIITLVKAFLNIKKSYPKIKLVLVGQEGYGYQDIRSTIKSLPKDIQKDIVTLGYVRKEDLPSLYANARIFVFPSKYEGFGMPILEAQACGCPVVCSNTSSFLEVGGNSVIYFDPNNALQIAERILYLLCDNKKRDDIIKKGFQNIKRFSWEKCARETLKLIESS